MIFLSAGQQLTGRFYFWLIWMTYVDKFDICDDRQRVRRRMQIPVEQSYH